MHVNLRRCDAKVHLSAVLTHIGEMQLKRQTMPRSNSNRRTLKREPGGRPRSVAAVKLNKYERERVDVTFLCSTTSRT